MADSESLSEYCTAERKRRNCSNFGIKVNTQKNETNAQVLLSERMCQLLFAFESIRIRI